jgi:hypothetical protein
VIRFTDALGVVVQGLPAHDRPPAQSEGTQQLGCREADQEGQGRQGGANSSSMSDDRTVERNGPQIRKATSGGFT